MRILLLVLCFSPFLYAADATKPHNHQGNGKTYVAEPPKVPLSQAELTQINSGTPVYKQTAEGNGGNAVAVFKVDAPAPVIWKVLSDMESYPKFISNLKEAKIYKKDGDKIFAEFTIKVWPTTTTYFIEHDFQFEKKGYGTWKLDYSRLSDLEESIGFWRVAPVEGQANQCIVYYSVDVQIKGFLSFIKGFIVDKGLKEATSWVKIAAEQKYAETKKSPVTATAPATTTDLAKSK